ALALRQEHVNPPPADAARVYSERGEVYWLRGEYERALADYEQAAALDPSAATHWSGQAQIHARRRDWQKAAQAYGEALKRSPKDAYLTLAWAGALVQLKAWGRAAQAYRAAIELDPKSLSRRLRLAAGPPQPGAPDKPVSREQWQEASRCLAGAVTEFPNEPSAWLDLAVVQLAAGDAKDYRDTRGRVLEQFRSAGPEAASAAA